MQEKVRTGAIEVRKVRGDVNPADLFTKHLPSNDKVHQLTKLFGCEYRAGRSMAAPLLRPQKKDGGGDGCPPTAGHLPTFGVAEPSAHNVSVLPHMHSDKDMSLLFPMLSAPPIADNVDDWSPEEEQEDIKNADRKKTDIADVSGRRTKRRRSEG